MFENRIDIGLAGYNPLPLFSALPIPVMNARPVIRIAQFQDAEAIGALYQQLVGDPRIRVDGRRIQEISDDPRTRLFVCEVNKAIAATVLVSLCSDVMYGDQPFAVVENLFVDSQHRGNGLGGTLLQEVEQFCLKEDCSKIMLMSTVTRVDAHRFFERMGFHSDAKRAFVKYRKQFALAT